MSNEEKAEKLAHSVLKFRNFDVILPDCAHFLCGATQFRSGVNGTDGVAVLELV